MRDSKFRSFLVPIISVIFGLVLGAIIMWAFGFDPILGYRSLLKASVGKPYYIGETLREATPLILVGLGFAVANKAGFFNIGVAGQVVMGWLFSVWIALIFPGLPKIILLPLCLLCGFLGGALWASIAGVLKAFFNTSEVIVTIMLNYISLSVFNYLVRDVITDKMDTTDKIVPAASLKMEWLTTLTKNSTLHGGIFIALAAVVIVWILLNNTTIGFELKTVGLNKYAAEYAGMSAKKNIILAMALSGGLAGLGGAMEGLGTFNFLFILHSLPDIGFDGMAVALLGMSNPIGIIFSGLLFSILRIGGIAMPLLAKIPTEVVSIVIASIIFFVGADYVIRLGMDKILPNKKGKVN